MPSVSIQSAHFPTSLAFTAGVLAMSVVWGCGQSSDPSAEAESGDLQKAPEAVAQAEGGSEKRKEGGVDLRRIDVGPENPAAALEVPPIRLEPAMLDFGFIAPGTDVQGTVKLINTSQEPLTILAAQPTCKCTTLNDISGSIIQPGESMELEAELAASPNPGPKTAAIKILVNGYPRPLEVDLKAEISLPIRAIPPYINAVQGKNTKGRIVIESIDKSPFTICSVHGEVPNLVGFDPKTDEPRSKYIMVYDLDDIPVPYPRYLLVSTDNPDVPIIDIYFRHETTLPKINRNMLVHEGYRHSFGRIDVGSTAEIEIGFSDLVEPIATVISNSPDARVELLSSRNETIGGKVISFQKIKIIPAKDFEGSMYFPITFLANSGQSTDVPVFGAVVPAGEACVTAE
jgi:hypothetical protein